MRNVSNKICTETHYTLFMFNNIFRNRLLYGIMWKNNVQPDRPQMANGACA